MPWNEDLVDALHNGFDPGEFDRFLKLRLQRLRTTYSADAVFPTVVANVVAGAERELWVPDLVRAALKAVPRSTALLAFVEHYPDKVPARLQGGDGTDLQRGLDAAFPTFQDVGQLLTALSADADEVVGIQDREAAGAYLPRIIEWFDRRVRTEELINAALALRQNDATLRACGKRVLAALRMRDFRSGLLKMDPYQVCVLPGRPFMDRKDLRLHLRSLSQPNTAKPIVAISGPSKSGKTHSAHFVRFVKTRERTFEAGVLELEEEQHTEYRPDHFARSVLSQVGRNDRVKDIPARDSSAPARWGREVCEWLFGEARTSGRIWVIVLDGFTHVDLHADTKELVQAMVKRASRDDAPIRLVLLGYTEDMLVPLDTTAVVARESLSALTADHVRETFQNLAALRGETPDAALLDEIVDDVMKGLPTGPERHRTLAKRVWEWIEDLQNGDGG